MAIERDTVRVTAESDLESLLDEAEGAPIFLERRGVLYRLSREPATESIEYEPDPEGVSRTLDATIGSWADLDIDRIIREIYEAREAGSRPPDRP
jgi:hypothetical protein